MRSRIANPYYRPATHVFADGGQHPTQPAQLDRDCFNIELGGAHSASSAIKPRCDPRRRLRVLRARISSPHYDAPEPSGP